MTIYVDNFHTISASRGDDGFRRSNMIGTDDAELHKFARIVGTGCCLAHAGIRYELTEEALHRAVALGAVMVKYQDLAAMYSLRLMGFDMGRASTARARRSRIALQVLEETSL